jgi:hypothetical protein
LSEKRQNIARFCITREVFGTQIGGIITMPQAQKEISGYTEFPIDQISHEKNKILQNQLFKLLLVYAYFENAN